MYKKLIAVLFSMLLLMSSCSQKEEYFSREIYAMNTVISIYIPSETQGAEKICNDAVYYINDLENMLSANIADSSVSAFNGTAGQYKAEGEFLDVMYYALDIAKKTDGAFDPTCLPLTRLWKISDGGYLPDENEVNMALANVGYESINMENDILTKSSAVCLDLGGIAKGYALGRTVQSLSEKAGYGMVSFGGNVGVWGVKPDGTDWEIGIKDPFNPEGIVGKVILPELG